METLFKYKTNESNFNEVKTAAEFYGKRKRIFGWRLSNSLRNYVARPSLAKEGQFFLRDSPLTFTFFAPVVCI